MRNYIKEKRSGLVLFMMTASLAAAVLIFHGGVLQAEKVVVLEGPELRAEVSRSPFSLCVRDPIGREILQSTDRVENAPLKRSYNFEFRN